MDTESPQEPRFEDLIDALETVVKELESGELSLEDALMRFEKGVGLAKQAELILDGAEARVERLLENRDGGHATEPVEIS